MRKLALLMFLALAGLARAQTASAPFTITTTSSSTTGCAQIAINDKATVGIAVSGTWTGTLQPEVQIGNGTPTNSYVYPSTSNTSQTTITANGNYSGPVGSYSVFLLCGPTSTGTASVTLTISPAVNASQFGSSSGGTLTGITAGNGISVTGSAPSPTVSLNITCPSPLNCASETGVSFITTPLTGQPLYANNALQPSFSSPKIQDCNSGSAVTTSPYTIQVDSSTALVDRGTVCRFQSGASAVTVPLSTATGAGGLFFKAMDDGAGTLTVSRTTGDTFSVFNGVTASDSQTSFTMANGNFVTMTQGATGLWEADLFQLQNLGTPTTLTLTNATGLPLNGVVSPTGAIATIALGNNPLTINSSTTTNSQSAVTIGETAAATGTSDSQLTLSTAAASPSVPLTITQGSNTTATTTPSISVTKTLNDSGLTDEAIKVAVTNTSSTGCLFYLFNGGSAGSTLASEMDCSGDLIMAGVVTGTTSTQVVTVCGGNSITCSQGANAAGGGVLVQGMDNSGTGASDKGGPVIIRGGILTASAPSGSGLEGTVNIGAGFLKGTAIANLGDVVCATTTAFTVTDCPHSTVATNIVGVAGNTSNPIGVIAYGLALVKLDGALTAIGDHVCMSTTTDGEGHDNGSTTTACTLGTSIGVIIADSGTITQMSGASNASTAMSTTLVLVQLHIDN